MKVELVAAMTPEDIFLVTCDVHPGTSIEAVIQQSGVLEQYPMIDLQTWKVGIYSQKKPLDTIVQAGDRVEIYRPLARDPKTIRRERAKRQQQANS